MTPRKALSSPRREAARRRPQVPPAKLGGPRKTTLWAGKELQADRADQGFYRICGVKGSGKSHLTKLFILDVLREVEANPKAKLIVYEPKREFYAWICSLGLKSPIHYFMPSDCRGEALDFTKDYPHEQDSQTLSYAFFPLDLNERQQRFWGDALRTIYGQVFTAIKGRLGYADLRLICLVLEDEDLTQAVLGHDPYLVQARYLLPKSGVTVGETKGNILATLHSRIAEMKVLATQLDYARENGLLSLEEFVKKVGSRVLVVSRDPKFKLIQDPMNGVLFLRLLQILDGEQADELRKMFIVIDELPLMTGDKPCPGIVEALLLLRSRGVTFLLTYQALTTLKRIYGEEASEAIGQCTNVIYLRQTDVPSAVYAADDLGREWGHERLGSASYGGGKTGDGKTSNWVFQQNKQWYDRPIYPPTVLLNHLPTGGFPKRVTPRSSFPALRFEVAAPAA